MMPSDTVANQTRKRFSRNAALLATASAMALSLAGYQPAFARQPGVSGAVTSAPGIASDAARAAAQQAAAIAARGQASMMRATQALQAMQAVQQAARNAAAGASSAVTNGLSSGGLVVDPRVTSGADPTLWQNLSAPVQTTDGSQTTVTLTQSSQRAIATWQQFNVGRNTTVNFDQSGGNSDTGNSWVVLNRIDATGSPSQIQGQINAQGTVLIINPNGIIFSGSSQINVHSLVASAMEMNSFTGAANGAFKASGAAYVPVLVDGSMQATPNGTLILAPSDEANANKVFSGTGLFVNATLQTTLNGGPVTTGNTALFSAGLVPGQGNVGVRVEAGASISTNVSGFDNGGFVALLGPQVTNAGSIATSAGQIILAAGSSVQIGAPAAGTNLTSDVVRTGAAISGILLYAPPTVSGGSSVRNDVGAILISERGNITLVGDAVQQNGLAGATTSITRPGSITVVANGANAGNQVLFGTQSITAILPDENGETIPSDPTSLAAFTPPRIDVAGANVDFQSGSWVWAPSATMAVTGPGNNQPDGSMPLALGRVVLESGSLIDLSGLSATRSVSDYLYTFKVTANDVADTPLAQAMIGHTVTIDLSLTGTRADGETWVGSPLFASSGAGYLTNVTQGIDQLLSKGGSLMFGGGVSVGNNQKAGGFTDVLQVAGSAIDLSGGALAFTGARITTTQVIGSDGRRYDIGSANPFIGASARSGFTVLHPHWNVTDTYNSPLLSGSHYKPGYVDGLSAGSLAITAVNPLLEGDIGSDIVIGDHQRELAQIGTGTGGAQTTPDQLPLGAALTITLLAVGDKTTPHDAVVLAASASDVLGPDFTFNSSLTLPKNSDGKSTVTYGTDRLSSFDLGSVSITGADTLTVAAGANLTVRDGGSIKLGGVTTVDGVLTAHGGNITLSGVQPVAFMTAMPSLILGADAMLDVSGRWINDTGELGGNVSGVLYIDGGSVSLSTLNFSQFVSHDSIAGTVVATDGSASIILQGGSVIDVSSGGYVGSNGKVATGSNGLPKGKGGNLSLLTYTGSWSANSGVSDEAFGLDNKVDFAPRAATNANVLMDGTIYAGGLSQGGSFTLQVPEIVIDGRATAVTPITSGVQAGTIVLPTSFFTDSGFGSFKLTSTYGSITLTAGTTLRLEQQNYQLPSLGVLPASGARVREFASFGYALDGLRQAANLSLTQSPYPFGLPGDRSNTATLLIGQAAQIVADPLATITLASTGVADVLGDISAPGGSITINSLYTWIGAQAVLDVSGIFVPNPHVTAYITGSVLPGGSIALSGANVVANEGSVFDISGASGTIELPVSASQGGLISQPIWSNGGTLTLSNNALYFGGTIKAAGGAPSAVGGRLSVTNTATLGDILLTQGDDFISNFAGTPPATALNFIGLLTRAPGAQQLTSTSAVTTAVGSRNLTVQTSLSANLMQPGKTIVLTGVDSSGHAVTMIGTLNSYNATTGALNMTVSLVNGGTSSTSLSQWAVAVLPRTSFIAANTINSAISGLDTVALTGALYLGGNVNLDIAGSLLLDNQGRVTSLLPAGVSNTAFSPSACAPAGNCIPTIGGTRDVLEAGYIRFFNATGGANVLPTLADGALTLEASTAIDLVGAPTVSNAGTVNIVSGGDLRLIGDNSLGPNGTITITSTSDGFGGRPWVGAFRVADDLNITAREVYPTTDTAFLLMSLGLAPAGATGTHNTIAFASNGAMPVAPLSAGGAIVVDAKTIVQGGALFAPLGTIQLGFGPGQTLPAIFTTGATNDPYDPVQKGDTGTPGTPAVATASVTLMPGSLTSVSANGLIIPYGATTDGINWTDNSTLLNGPPAKLIVLGGVKVDTRAGAVIDGSGGGDVYATEFVPGTGGSRNVLTTSSQTVYALVPGFGSSLAAYDPSFTTSVAAGMTVTIAGGNGIPAGTYTLLPAEYATLPGAYRVAVVSTNASPATQSGVSADGSVYLTGVFGNAINGSRSAQTALLQIQSDAVWTRYSEIDIAKGSAYFPALAATNGTAVPRLAQDAARMVVTAGTSLLLDATNRFAPAPGGLGGQLDITGTNLVVAASDQLNNFGTTVNGTFTPSAAYAGYLFLDVDMLSNLGIESTLIGGYRGNSTEGTLITATALNVEIATDSAHALTGPELLFSSLAPTAANATAHGLVVDSGSVIEAEGTVAGNSTAALVIGVDPVLNAAGTGWTTGVSGDGALLRVSNGGLVDVIRHFVPGIYQVPSSTPAPTGPVSTVARGSLTIGAGAVLSGNTLTLDSSGTTIVPVSANLTAKNYDLSGAVINLGDGTGGLVISTDLIGKFAGADTVRLRSASVFYLSGNNTFGDPDNPIGTLIFDGAGLYSNGGKTTIAADNIILVNTQQTASSAVINTSGSGGQLTIEAGDTFTFGAGAKTLSGFAGVTATAGSEVLFTGGGGLDAKGASVSLTAPLFLVDAATSQSLTTTGALTFAQGAGTAPGIATTTIGGILALTGGSVDVSGTLVAQGGSLTLEATAGALSLSDDAEVSTQGTRIMIGDLIQDTPAGNIRLISDVGNVTLGAGSTVDVSGAGYGFAGSLTILAGDTAQMAGTLKGGAAFSDLGGEFTLIANRLGSALPFLSGFTRSFETSLGQGNIDITAGTTLTSEKVLLVANTGYVNVEGTIDASAASGGSIALYGAGNATAPAGSSSASGVTIASTAKLYARYQAPDPDSPGYGNGSATLVQRGGTITLGTTGTPDADHGLNNQYGYENISASGAITVQAGAIFDVSGGAGGANIDNTGGSVIVRAPILTSNSINVSFNGTVVTNAKADGTASGDPLVVNAFAVWSTTDNVVDPNKHFDGIIDPAGFFDGNGNRLITATNGLYPTSTAQAPAAGAYLPHVAFYQTTLLNFVNNPFDAAAVANDFRSALLKVGSNDAVTMPPEFRHLRPELDLVNPTPATGPTSVNGGNITVASNWNFGAGSLDTNGNIDLLYRTANGGEPGTLILRAANNVRINATISDGFFVNYVLSNRAPDAVPVYDAELASSNYLAYLSMLNGDGLPVYDKSLMLYGADALGLSWADYIGDPNAPAPPGAPMAASAGFFNTSATVFSAIQFKLQEPAILSCGGAACPINIIDQYNQYYGQYARMFDAYAAVTYYNNSQLAGDGGMGGTFAPYQYIVDYYTYFGATVDLSHVVIPAAPTLNSSYYLSSGLQLSFNRSTGFTTATGNDYASQWTAYLFNILVTDSYLTYGGQSLTAAPTLANINDTNRSTAGVFNLAPTPPFAPPAYTTPQTGYVSSLISNPTPPSNLIANDPAIYSVGNVAYYNTTSAANLMTAAMSGKGSFSYNIVGGAFFNGDGTASVNPDAVVQLAALSPSVTGNVSIDGHTSYINPFTDPSIPGGGGSRTNLTIDVPTMVRTGTGSITIAAAGDFALLDPVAPGAVYTAGHVTDNAAGFTAPTLPSGAVSNGLISTPAWATGGGNITVTAGRDIIGIETPVDPTGSQFSTGSTSAGVSTGQFWSAWYYVDGVSTGNAVAPFDPSAGGVQFSSWINYGSFFQQFGALGGGNITLQAGRNVRDVSASLPETIQVSGGQSAGGPAAVANYFGGGDLLVQAGNDVLSGVYYVGRGTGLIRAGADVISDATLNLSFYRNNAPTTISPSTGKKTPFAVPLMLAVQDSTISVEAAGAITLGGIFEPTSIRADLISNVLPLTSDAGSAARTLPAAMGAAFDSFGANSGVTLLSSTGSITVNTLLQADNNTGTTDTLFTHTTRGSGFVGGGVPNNIVAPSLSVTALTGDIQFGNGVQLFPSPTGELGLIAGGSISGGNVTMLDGNNVVSMLGSPIAALVAPLHAGDDIPVLIYAGEDINGGSFNLLKSARLWAGRDVANVALVGMNVAEDDITSVVAGRDILARRPVDVIGAGVPSIFTLLTLYGPGDFLVSAGRNLGPFSTVDPATIARNAPLFLGGGIFAIGNGANSSLRNIVVKPYLPQQGANIDLLYGVGGGIDYAAAIARYGNPATAAASGIDFVSGIIPQLDQLLQQLIVQQAKAAGIANPNVTIALTPAEAGEIFPMLGTLSINGKLADLAAKAGLKNLTFNLTSTQFLSQLHQQDAMQLTIDQGFLAVLKQVGLDFNDPSSRYAGQYARAYEAISTLFPASLGYTDNSAGGSGVVPPLEHTGDLRMARSLVETQTGGDVDILGPGGSAFVGSNSADTLTPAQQGILTLQGGSIRSYTDGSVLVYQSRVFTEQGGNIEMFSANGDLNAGKGPKSSAAYPPLRLICDADGYCRVNPAGLVTGAGVGALLSVPGQDPDASNVILTAPHGIIDAGAAGIRVAGNLNLVALQVLNAFNIQVGGTTTGIAVPQGAPVNALTSANNTAGAAAKSADVPAQSNKEQPSVIIVEVLGYGGGSDADQPSHEEKRERGQGRQGYNPDSAFQIIGLGEAKP